jgi:hypothetical protein
MFVQKITETTLNRTTSAEKEKIERDQCQKVGMDAQGVKQKAYTHGAYLDYMTADRGPTSLALRSECSHYNHGPKESIRVRQIQENVQPNA